MANGRSYELIFHHEFPKDLKKVPANLRERILRAIQERLAQAPEQYGERLRQSLHGYWKLRVGDFRVVFEIAGRTVRIYGARDRREVYGAVGKRTAKGWPADPSPLPSPTPRGRR